MYHDRSNHSSDQPGSVTLTGQDLTDAKRLLSLLTEPRRSPAEMDVARGSLALETSNADRQTLIQRATTAFSARRRRMQLFAKAMFGEPAWDMLLALYVVEERGSRQTISTLTQYSGAPPTTALRWLDYLEKQQLIRRESHPTDRRAIFVEITDKARAALDMYFSETLTTEA